MNDTLSDPFAYSEGPSEPQPLIVDEPLSLGERALFWFCAIGIPVLALLIVAGWL